MAHLCAGAACRGTACPVRRPSPWWTVTRSALSVAFVFEPVIGHIKTDGHLGRCYLKGREGDAANVVLTAISHNRVRPRLAEGVPALNPARPVLGFRLVKPACIMEPMG